MELDGGVRKVAGMRWNPTADQITLLESLYKQGVRNPSAEQIQQITTSLKVFGYVEGKNVFYWFQNHKARQRQKQKQDNIAYSNRCFRRDAPMAYSPAANFQNVVCRPYYLPINELGYFQRYPKVLLQAGGISNRTTPSTSYTFEDSKQETLPLFPLEPSSVLQTRSSSRSHFLAPSNTTTPLSSSEIDEQPNFFNFLAVNGLCESD